MTRTKKSTCASIVPVRSVIASPLLRTSQLCHARKHFVHHHDSQALCCRSNRLPAQTVNSGARNTFLKVTTNFFFSGSEISLRRHFWKHLYEGELDYTRQNGSKGSVGARDTHAWRKERFCGNGNWNDGIHSFYDSSQGHDL